MVGTIQTSGMQLEGPYRRRRYTPAETPEVPAEEPQEEGAVEPSAETETVPEKVVDVKEWVGEDSDRALAALEVEQAKPEAEQRATLLTWLQDILVG